MMKKIIVCLAVIMIASNCIGQNTVQWSLNVQAPLIFIEDDIIGVVTGSPNATYAIELVNKTNTTIKQRIYIGRIGNDSVGNFSVVVYEDVYKPGLYYLNMIVGNNTVATQEITLAFSEGFIQKKTDDQQNQYIQTDNARDNAQENKINRLVGIINDLRGIIFWLGVLFIFCFNIVFVRVFLPWLYARQDQAKIIMRWKRDRSGVKNNITEYNEGTQSLLPDDKLPIQLELGELVLQLKDLPGFTAEQIRRTLIDATGNYGLAERAFMLSEAIDEQNKAAGKATSGQDYVDWLEEMQKDSAIKKEDEHEN